MSVDIRIATRQSELALWQANYVKGRLHEAYPEASIEIIGMTTEGDRNQRASLAGIGGKGLFVKELELALVQDRADIAVHSMKDVPAVLPDGLEIAAICERDDPRDAFVSNLYKSLDDMPSQSRLGSSSLRRRLQVKHNYPEFTYLDLRGNVNTRLRKLDEGEYDAIILAVAGLKRLRMDNRIAHSIDSAVSIPSAGQGAVGIECRCDDDSMKAVLETINHEPTRHSVVCERMVSSALGATCNLPIGVFAEIDGERMRLSAFVSNLEGDHFLRDSIDGPVLEGMDLAGRLSDRLVANGARELIDAAGAHSS